MPRDPGSTSPLDDTLPLLPRIDVEVVADHSAELRGDAGFLRLRRVTLRNRRPDGTASRDYRYDLVERDAMDAVAIVLVARGAAGGELRVCLRSALRPPLAFRPGYALPLAETSAAPVVWEVPAGLVEPEEHGEAGLRACAAREAHEETGLEVEASAFTTLGPAVVLSPGVLAEKVHFLVALVEPERAGTPTEDGSPVEADAVVCFLPLSVALAAARDGRVTDVKTEVALRRLAEWSLPS
jgi:ADP-ribose pyrophosphatase